MQSIFSFKNNNSPQNNILLLFSQKNFEKRLFFLHCISVDKILHKIARTALDLEIDLGDVLPNDADGEEDESPEELERNDETCPADDGLPNEMADNRPDEHQPADE